MQNIHERLYIPRKNDVPNPIKLGQVTLSGFDFGHNDPDKRHVSYYACLDELTIPALQNLIRDLQDELADRLV